MHNKAMVKTLTMDSDNIIKHFIDNLTLKYESTSWSQLPFIYNDIQKEIITELQNSIGLVLGNRNDKVKLLQNDEFLFGNHRFEININSVKQFKNSEINQELHINFLQKGIKKRNLKYFESNQHISIGEFDETKIVMPKLLGRYEKDILEVSTLIVNTGTVFYKELLIDKITNHFHKNLSDELLKKLRLICERNNYPAVAEDVWFTLVHDNKGFYLIDTHRLYSIFKKLFSEIIENKKVPLDVIASFLSTSLEYDKMHSKILVDYKSKGEYLDINLNTSKYLEDNPSFQYSEEILFMSNKIAALLIFSDKDNKLIISFPVEIKPTIEQLMTEKTLNEFSKIFTDYREGISKFKWKLRKIQLPENIYRPIGQIISGVFNIPQLPNY